MNAKAKRRNAAEEGGDSSGTTEDLVLTTLIGNGEDLSPIVRHAFETGRPEPLLQQLRNVSKKKEAEIEDLCRLHWEEFIIAVDELRGVLVDAEELKVVLQTKNLILQDVGSILLSKLDELVDSYSIKKNISEAVKMCKICFQLLELCSKCNSHVSEGRFYPALKTIELIENNYLKKVPVRTLKLVLEERIPAIRLHIEKKVCSEVNECLFHIRSSAKDIGIKAIAHVASAREKEDETPPGHHHKDSKVKDSVYTLDVETIEEDLSLKIDLTPIYKAYHIHRCLGIGERFREYYYNNRLAQLNSDLQIFSAQSFTDCHQSFLGQIAGYFIVEDRALRTAGDLLEISQVETMWETAVSKVTSVAERQVAMLSNTSDLLRIKNYMTLFGETLRQHRYEVKSILEVMNSTKERYSKLIMYECRKKIKGIIANDSYEQMILKTESEYVSNVLDFQLQTSDIMPAFPYVAPFSSMVPEICHIVRSFIKDVITYFSSGGDMNIFDAVRKNLDSVLIDVVNEVILDKISEASIGVSRSMQIAANVSFLERACDFFVKTAGVLCGVPPRMMEHPQATLLNAKVVLKTSRDAAYISLLTSVNAQLDDLMSLPDQMNWIPDDEPQKGHDYMNEVIIYIDTLLSTAQQSLPLDALYKVGAGALEHVSNSLMSAFLSDSLKRFNGNVIVAIDFDLQILENFAEDRFNSYGLNEVYKEGFTYYLLEIRQLINLLLSNQPENFMNPVIRGKHYNTLDFKKVAIICEKFKDSADSLFGSLSNRNAKTSSRKKSMDVLKRRLKDFS